MSYRKGLSSSSDKGNSNLEIIIVAIIGLLGTLATAYFGFLSSARPVELTIYATQTAEVRLTQLANADTSKPLSAPTETIVSTTPTNNAFWNGAMSARLPTFQEMSNGILSSIWTENSIDVRDMFKPDTAVYYGKVQKNKEYLLPVYWCATSSDILNQNLAFISIQFSANGENIPDEYIGNFKYEPNKNWKCISYAVILNGWKENSQYTLEIKRTLFQNLNDGKSNYPAGDYMYRLVVDVP